MPVRAATDLAATLAVEGASERLPAAVMGRASGREVVEFPGEIRALLDGLYVMDVEQSGALAAEQAGDDAATTVACDRASPELAPAECVVERLHGLVSRP
jgi:hypothetical protein